jgi:hypothetical protein
MRQFTKKGCARWADTAIFRFDAGAGTHERKVIFKIFYQCFQF